MVTSRTSRKRRITTWRAAGERPLADTAAAARVTPSAETRPENARANRNVPTRAELRAFREAVYESGGARGMRLVDWNPLARHVTGRFRGSTDDILEWAAHKWGIPEDVVRAVALAESWWAQSQLGDRRDGTDAGGYPSLSRVDGDSVYESLGLMQVKWRPDGSLHPGTEPLRWESTAFNVDYWAASVRYFFDGLCGWCGPGYAAGDGWAAIGGWYDPSPWENPGKAAYVRKVKSRLDRRAWARPGF